MNIEDVNKYIQNFENSGDELLVSMAKSLKTYKTDIEKINALTKFKQEGIKKEMKMSNKALFPFNLDKLVMQEKEWKMHLTVYGKMDKIYKYYTVRFLVNLEPINEKIGANGRAKKQIEADNQMFPDQDTNGARLEKELEGLQEEKKVLIESCPEIVFSAFVAEVKNKPIESKIVFTIPADTINIVNDKRMMLSNYELQLEHIV